MVNVKKSICRICTAYCPVNVTVEDNRVVKVEGNRDAPLYEGYICPKGVGLTAAHNIPNRLKHHLKRLPDGSYQEISSEQLVEEVSKKMAQIIDQHGADAIAAFLGGPTTEQPACVPLAISFLQAIGSTSLYTASTIDQPGMMIAESLHGSWAGGHSDPDKVDVFLLVGTNPVVSKQYFPINPGKSIKRMLNNGTKLIVIDPCQTETARRADVHLQCLPGEDPTIIAGLIRQVIIHGGVNEAFTGLNADGLDTLTEVVDQFTPDYVAERAGIDKQDFLQAAEILVDANSGEFGSGVGPSMATRGTLTAYLMMCLQTIRGFWPEAGTKAVRPRRLLPRREFKAQPNAPTPGWGIGKKTRVRGLELTTAGMPLGALPEEILTPGEGQIRALILHGGGMITWPQTDLVKQALESLELLIVHDVDRELSPSAKMADYVIATHTEFEIASMTQYSEITSMFQTGNGLVQPYSAYHPAVVEPPANADLMESWQIYYRVAQRLGIKLKCVGFFQDPDRAPWLDMDEEPSLDALYEIMCHGSVIPLAEVKKYPDGKVFDEAAEVIQPRDPDCSARFELANPDMLEELAIVADESYINRRGLSDEYPLLFIPRRKQSTNNSSYRADHALKTSYNPAYMHSSDLDTLGLDSGDRVGIRSRHGEITGFVEQDDHVKPGVVAMVHGYGKYPDDSDYDPHKHGANVNNLLHWEDDYDAHCGMPRMGALPISVRPLNFFDK